MTDDFDLTVEHTGDGDRTVVRVAGDVDLTTAPGLRAGVIDLIEAGHRDVVMDMSKVRFCDSTGLSALIGIWHHARQAGGALGLAAVPGRLQRMLSMTGLDTVLPTYPADAAGLRG